MSPFHERTRALEAVYFGTAGWEGPHWYESNKGLLEEYDDRISNRPNEWDAPWWSPIINAENLAMRERVAMIDLSAFAIFDINGPGELKTVQKVTVSQMDIPTGKASYTLLLNVNGGIRSDLIIVRLAKESFRIQDIPVWALRISYVGEYGWEMFLGQKRARHGGVHFFPTTIKNGL